MGGKAKVYLPEVHALKSACGCRHHTFFNLWFSRVVSSTFRPFDPSDYWIGGWIWVVTGQNLVVSRNIVCDWNQASTPKFVATVQFKHQSWIIKLSTFFFCVWQRGQRNVASRLHPDSWKCPRPYHCHVVCEEHHVSLSCLCRSSHCD